MAHVPSVHHPQQMLEILRLYSFEHYGLFVSLPIHHRIWILRQLEHGREDLGFLDEVQNGYLEQSVFDLQAPR